MGCDIHLFSEKKVEGAWRAKEELIDAEGRNSFLFSMFSALQRDPGVDIVQMPLRGLPEDLSPGIMRIAAEVEEYHSFSYLSLRELLDIPWEERFFVRSTVTTKEYRNICKGTWVPYDNWISCEKSPAAVDLTSPQMPGFRPKKNSLVYLEWLATRLQFCSKFYLSVIPALYRICGGNIDNARLIYWFDG